MSANRRVSFSIAIALVLLLPILSAHAAPAIDQLLQSGKLDEAERLLVEHLDVEASDDLARFQLGSVRLLRAVEQLAQEGVRNGATTRSMMLPFIRLGGFSSDNANARQVTYDDVRAMIERFQQSVAEVETTLALIEATDLYWPIDFSKIALDFDGDGQTAKSEQLGNLFRWLTNPRQSGQGAQPLLIGLDSADVYWMRGYCHVLMAMADMVLAYDHQRMFDLTAHAYFTNPDTKFHRERNEDLKPKANSPWPWGSWESISDIIAAIHLMDFKLREPARMGDAREHLLQMVRLSRSNWELVLKETDDRHELIPNPEQKSVIPNLSVDAARLDAWQKFLDEAEAILEGEKLLPFWRSGFHEGVNLRQVFDDPRDFDLILWMQGTAALPYLEDGEQTDPALWREFQRIFRGRFLGFALWVN